MTLTTGKEDNHMTAACEQRVSSVIHSANTMISTFLYH